MAVIIGEVEVIRQSEPVQMRDQAPDALSAPLDRFSAQELCLATLRERERRDLRRRCD